MNEKMVNEIVNISLTHIETIQRDFQNEINNINNSGDIDVGLTPREYFDAQYYETKIDGKMQKCIFWAKAVNKYSVYNNNLSGNYIKRYVFPLKKNLYGTKFPDKPVLVAGNCTVNVLESEFVFHKWKIANTFKEAMEYIETLNLDDRYIFDMEDDVLEKIQKEVKSELEEYEKRKMRHLELKGDIIITDPCYIIKKRDTSNMPKYDDFFKYKNQSDYPDFDGKYSKMFLLDCERYNSAYDKWEQENPDNRDLWNDNDLSKFGINHFICHSTLSGDWSCTTINTDTNKSIGEFCADSGQVAVFLLDEVLQYNSDFNFHIEKPWTTTLIKDFDGEVFFEKIDSKTLIVRGIGNINFKTMQTGF